MAMGLKTYADLSKREDLLKIIADINPDETPLSTWLTQKPKQVKTIENELWKKLQILL